jgi:hypothetical protein
MKMTWMAALVAGLLSMPVIASAQEGDSAHDTCAFCAGDADAECTCAHGAPAAEAEACAHCAGDADAPCTCAEHAGEEGGDHASCAHCAGDPDAECTCGAM